MAEETGDDGKRIELRMGNAVSGADQQPDSRDEARSGDHAGSGAGPRVTAGQPEPTRPVMGWIAVACGILGIFTYGIIFVPIAFVCSIIALFMGQGMWAFLGFLTAFVGLLTSPALLAVLGLGALAAYFGIPLTP